MTTFVTIFSQLNIFHKKFSIGNLWEKKNDRTSVGTVCPMRIFRECHVIEILSVWMMEVRQMQLWEVSLDLVGRKADRLTDLRYFYR